MIATKLYDFSMETEISITIEDIYKALKYHDLEILKHFNDDSLTDQQYLFYAINNESGKTLISVSCISDFYGKVLGKIEIYSNGDQIGYDYYGQIVGYYYQETNTTTDFKGTIVSYGNTLSSLIMQPVINEL